MLIVPRIIQIELTAVCNHRCTYCAHSTRLSRDGNFFMSLDSFQFLIDKAAEAGVKEVKMFFMGESTVHKDFMACMKYVKECGLVFRLATNMYGIGQREAAWMNENLQEIDLIGISIPSVTPEMHKKMTQSDDLERELENIKHLLDNKGQYALYVQRCITPTNDTLAEREAFDLFFAPYRDKLFDVKHDHIFDKGGQDHDQSTHEVSNVSECITLDETMTVLVNGDVCLCSMDVHGDVILGNVFKEDILEVHNNEATNMYRDKYPMGLCDGCIMQGLC